MTKPYLVISRNDEGRAPDDALRDAVQQGWDEAWRPIVDATMIVYALSFYKDVSLVEISLESAMPANARFYCLVHDGMVFWLRGVSPPIHEVNAKSRPYLRADNVLEYLAFFCFFVRGKDGPFLIVDTEDNQFVPDLPDRKAFDAAFQAPRVWGQNEDGDWRVSAMVYYADAVFVADFLVHLGGMVEMMHDHPVLADLPHRVDAPLGGKRHDS